MKMRLIDADALKKEYRMADRCEDCARNSRDCQNVYSWTLMDVCSMLDDAPTIGGWISVEDRLPYVDKDSGYECEVLAIVSGYDTESKCRYDHGLTLMTYSSIPELKSEWYKSDTFAPLMVHYWQSLPEPPEEDANGESKI